MRRVLRVVAALLLVACSSGDPNDAPQVELGRAECVECRMNVEDARYMAAVRTADGATEAFDSVECVIKRLRRDASGTVWLTDFESPGTWVQATDATVVRAGFPSPMGGGYAAFANPERAQGIAAERGGVAGSLDAFVSGSLTGGSTP